MYDRNEAEVLTKVTKYNLIRTDRMIHIDVHERLAGNLAGSYIAVPNLITIIAKSEYQGVGESEEEALNACLTKIKGVDIEEIFPVTKPAAERPAGEQG